MQRGPRRAVLALAGLAAASLPQVLGVPPSLAVAAALATVSGLASYGGPGLLRPEAAAEKLSVSELGRKLLAATDCSSEGICQATAPAASSWFSSPISSRAASTTSTFNSTPSNSTHNSSSSSSTDSSTTATGCSSFRVESNSESRNLLRDEREEQCPSGSSLTLEAHAVQGESSQEQEQPVVPSAISSSARHSSRVGRERATQQRRHSSLPECQATPGPRADPNFLQRLRPCGNLSSICTDIPLVEANRDYPGGGVGAVEPGQDYLVQFDIGLHPEVAKDILSQRLREFDSCVSCPQFEEQCMEVVVTGGDSWGDLGNPGLGLPSEAYDCMGGCGVGCKAPGRTNEDIGAFDCLKHDVCSAWKAVRTGRRTQGFCHDPDCGDEAAMAIYNCWKGFRLFGSLGGSRPGPFSEPAVCDRADPSIRGCWSHSGWFTQGRCKVFQGWDKGQGIPDPHPLRSPIQRL